MTKQTIRIQCVARLQIDAYCRIVAKVQILAWTKSKPESCRGQAWKHEGRHSRSSKVPDRGQQWKGHQNESWIPTNNSRVATATPSISNCHQVWRVQLIQQNIVRNLDSAPRNERGEQDPPQSTAILHMKISRRPNLRNQCRK